MSKITSFVEKIEKMDKIIKRANVSKFDVFMHRYCKWLYFAAVPFFCLMYSCEKIAKYNLVLSFLVVCAWFYSALFCFLDIHNLCKRIFDKSK